MIFTLLRLRKTEGDFGETTEMASTNGKRLIGFGIGTLGIVVAYVIAVIPHPSFAPPHSAQNLLDHADALSWDNRWADAKPLYVESASLFRKQGQPAKALYAEASEIPADESTSLSTKILHLTQALDTTEGQVPATRLRLLTIRGMLEINYDAAQALATWREVQRLALDQHAYMLATRAGGEEGIAAFVLGDTETAKNQVVKAWGLSKVEHDLAATVRYASIFGVGLVQIHRYKEALTPLDKAIKLAADNPQVAYPSIAVYGKIDALDGLHEYGQALQLANASLKRLEGTPYDGERSQILLSRGSVELRQGDIDAAIADYRQVSAISQRIANNRGIVNAGGLLATAYRQQQDLPHALQAIDEAIAANTKIPEELYLVPRNLAIKADILTKMGRTQQGGDLYKKAIILVNRMIQHAPTTNVQRQLLAEMSDVYSGYFSTLCEQHRYNDALQILDNVRGRVEAEALEHHESKPVREATTEDKALTQLNLSLINTDDPESREEISNAIYNTEIFETNTLARESVTHPVNLAELQKALGPNTLLVEYVLAEPASYVLAITHNTVRHYQLPAKEQIESDASAYRKTIRAQKKDGPLAQKLFGELLAPVPEYATKTDLTVVPDGALHLLPFSALQDQQGYVLETHTIDVNPSATVYTLLRNRLDNQNHAAMPYVGVAAWTQPTDTRNPILRAVSGPKRSELVPLPDSKREVEAIAHDFPQPNTILEGADATESHFKELPLDSTQVIHLALHGYADVDYPDRSALIFAPEASGANDGLLQIREIRKMHLNSKLVTLSACDTGVGPVGETGIANLVNAFIEAGADSVVSTLWELADQPTSRLMTNFYGGLSQHSRKVDALRAAQLELLHKNLPPYYWASFQLVGDANGNL